VSAAPAGPELPPPFAGLAFSALVGQEAMRSALLLCAVNPGLGGLLLRGERGTAKSTAVRALARLLPAITVVAGCPFHCHPSTGPWCPTCERRRADGGQLPRTRMVPRVVELPVGATLDRLVGTIDFEAAIRSGRRRYQPGVLADANRQVLYVDEVNLLDDGCVDVLLDVAQSGVNIVEREGVSIVHPSAFVLVGTMNPEEGDLRPQLLDRFGLCVDVRGLRDPALRVAVIERHPGRDGPVDQAAAGADRRLAATVRRARALLPRTEAGPAELRLASALAVAEQVRGHRADLLLVRAARTWCALRAAATPEARGPAPADPRLTVTTQDLAAVSEFVLVHRRRPPDGHGSAAAPVAEAPPAAGDRQDGEAREATASADPAGQDQRTGASVSQASAGAESAAGAGSQAAGTAEASGPEGAPVEAEAPPPPFRVRRLQLPRERRTRRAPGRRTPVPSGSRRGRYVRATIVEKPQDLALDATLRAAAPHQLDRRAAAAARDPAPDGPERLHLRRHDLREKVRQRRIGHCIVFVVDASASMDAEQRMEATKGAVLALLEDAYVRRDRVALVVFSGRTARVVLRPTGSVDLAERQLAGLGVGGTTPLTHGLLTALHLVETEKRRDPGVLPLLVLITDGRGNISCFGDEPLLEAQRAAAQIHRAGIRSVVIDSARNHRPPGEPLPPAPAAALFAGYSFNACADLAERLGARSYGLYDLSEQSILGTVSQALRP